MTREREDGWCLGCGDTFRYDDTGGYNPPCRCAMQCRSCCAARCEEEGDDADENANYETTDD